MQRNVPKYRADEPRPVVGPAGSVKLLSAAVEQRGAHRLGTVAELRVVGVAEAQVSETQAGQVGPLVKAIQRPEQLARRLGLLAVAGGRADGDERLADDILQRTPNLAHALDLELEAPLLGLDGQQFGDGLGLSRGRAVQYEHSHD